MLLASLGDSETFPINFFRKGFKMTNIPIVFPLYFLIECVIGCVIRPSESLVLELLIKSFIRAAPL